MSMSNQRVQVRAEADRNCCRTYLYFLSDRKNMTNQRLRELLQELPAELHRRRNRPAEQVPAELC
jgi:hypothetical protein